MQILYGVKIAKPLPFQMVAAVSCPSKNLQNNRTQFLICVQKNLFFSNYLKPKQYKTFKAHSSQGSFSGKSLSSSRF